MSESLEEDVLISLRRISRAIDLHSRYLANTFGLTGPQLVCLRALRTHDSFTSSQLARQVSLSQATVTGIVDRLLTRQLVNRVRSETDRRQVTVSITDAGRALLKDAPSPLQEKFAVRLAALDEPAKVNIRDTLRQIVAMMGGDDLQALPVLAVDSESPEELVAPVADDFRESLDDE